MHLRDPPVGQYQFLRLTAFTAGHGWVCRTSCSNIQNGVGLSSFGTMVDASERLGVLLMQESVHYPTCDYLSRIHAKVEGDGSPSSNKKRKSLFGAEGSDHESSSAAPATPAMPQRTGEDGTVTQINKQWREKICEWAYQGECDAMHMCMPRSRPGEFGGRGSHRSVANVRPCPSLPRPQSSTTSICTERS